MVPEGEHQSREGAITFPVVSLGVSKRVSSWVKEVPHRLFGKSLFFFCGVVFGRVFSPLKYAA